MTTSYLSYIQYGKYRITDRMMMVSETSRQSIFKLPTGRDTVIVSFFILVYFFVKQYTLAEATRNLPSAPRSQRARGSSAQDVSRSGCLGII